MGRTDRACSYMTWALVLAVVALLSSAISLTMPGWILNNSMAGSFSGLWVRCVNWTLCQPILNMAFNSKEMAVWMTMWVTQSLGVLLLIGSVCAGVVALRRPDYILKARFVFVVFSMFAGFSMFSGVFVFLVVNAVTGEGRSQMVTYHYSLFLAVAGSVLAWISALVAALYHDFQIITKRMSMPPGFDVINVGNLPKEPAVLDTTLASKQAS